MSKRNPTPLQVGMSGTLAGRTYRVAGRIVLSMDDAGETYYWNEFFLKSNEGDEATLVFEETETGGEWRLFTMFEPDQSITAREAAAKRVGDPVRFEDRDLRVTLVDESRVEYIEGEAPEGVERGDVARYFNAEGANRMFVVSWTGDEVECYRGADLQPRVVSEAFGLSGAELNRLAGPSRAAIFAQQQFGSGSRTKLVFAGVGVFIIAVVAFVITTQVGRANRRSVVPRTRAAVVPIASGASGTVDGKNYRVTGHQVVEIAQVGRVHERHEYLLQGEGEAAARLVCGMSADDPGWWLFTPLNPIEALSPQRAAQLQVGQKVTVDGYEATVSEIFQTRVRQVTDSTPTPGGAAVTQFGVTARAGAFVLLVTWNNTDIEFDCGQRVDAKSVQASFQASAPLEATK